MQRIKIIKLSVLFMMSASWGNSVLGETLPCLPTSPQKGQGASLQKNDQGTVTLQKTLERAYMQNTDLDAARAGLRATDENVSQANADWRPSLSAQGSQQYVQTYPIGNHDIFSRSHSNTLQYTATISQNLFKGGQTIANMEIAESQVCAGKADLFVTEQQILLAAISAHEGIRANQDIVNYQRQNVEFNRHFLERTKARYEVGEVSRTDVAASEASYDQAEADLSIAIGQLETVKAQYKQITGCAPESIAPTEILLKLPAVYEEALEIALLCNPFIMRAKYLLDASIYNVDLQLGALLPSLDVDASVGNSRVGGTGLFGRHRKQTDLRAEAVLSVPIYQQGITNSRVRQAYQQVSQRKVEWVGAQRTVERDAKIAWENLIAAREAVRALIAQVKAQELSVEGATAEADLGLKTIVDVLFLQQDLITAQVKLANAQLDLVTATYAVFQAMGKLMACNMKLKVRYYDPDEYYREYANAMFALKPDDRSYVKSAAVQCDPRDGSNCAKADEAGVLNQTIEVGEPVEPVEAVEVAEPMMEPLEPVETEALWIEE